MKDRIYIAGPMTGIKDYNFPEFFRAEKKLKKLGYDVENPARNKKPNPETWENYMRLAMVQLCKCDAIFMLKGYDTSKGAWLELHVAKKLSFEIISEE